MATSRPILVSSMLLVMYLLGSLSTMLLPIGFAAIAVAISAGVLLGLALAAAFAVYAFYRFTHVSPDINKTSPDQGECGGEDGLPFLHSISNLPNARDVTRPSGHSMPHAYALQGQYSGTVFTVPLSKWDRHRCVLDWPPGPPTFQVWRGVVSQGTLVLHPIPHAHAPSVNARRQNEGDKASQEQKKQKQEDHEETPLPPPQQKVGIPLDGCTVELVRECLNGRSDVVRRAPLLVAHPAWPLIDGEKAFFLFATDSAAKQQWQYALTYWSQGGEKLRNIEKTYNTFSAIVAQHALTPFVREKPLSPATGSGAAAQPRTGGASGSTGAGAEGSREQRHKWWNRGGSKKFRAQTLQTQGNGEHPPPPSGPSVNAPRDIQNTTSMAAATAAAAAVSQRPEAVSVERMPENSLDVDANANTVYTPCASAHAADAAQRSGAEGETLPDLDSIIEMRWMKSRKIPVPPAPPKSYRSGDNTPRSALSSAAPSPEKVPMAARNNLMNSASDHGTRQHRDLPSSPSRVPMSDGSTRAPVVPVNGHNRPRPTAEPITNTHNSSFPERSGADVVDASSLAESFAYRGREGGRESPSLVSPDHPPRLLPLPPHFPPLVSVDHFFNMATTRVCFDLVRNPAFAEHVRARIQRQLSRLHTPDYVQSLEVISVDPGSTAPSVANFAALPTPGNEVWPQMVFDMRYKGSFTVTIECKVDIRDAPAWATLGKALDKIEGGGKKVLKGATALGGKAVHAGFSGKPHVGEGSGSMKASSSKEGDSPQSDNYNNGSMDWYDSSDEDRLLAASSREGDSSGDEEETHHLPGEGESGPPRRQLMGKIRHQAAKRLRKLAESTASSIARLPLRVSFTFELLEGAMCVWVPPPPGDRLFWSFLAPPKLTLRAKPEIGGRLLKYAYHASKASAWIQARMELSFKKNLVFPSGGDIPLPLLLGVEDPRAADDIPGLREESRRQQGRSGAVGTVTAQAMAGPGPSNSKEAIPSQAVTPPANLAVVRAPQGQTSVSDASQGLQKPAIPATQGGDQATFVLRLRRQREGVTAEDYVDDSFSAGAS